MCSGLLCASVGRVDRQREQRDSIFSVDSRVRESLFERQPDADVHQRRSFRDVYEPVLLGLAVRQLYFAVGRDNTQRQQCDRLCGFVRSLRQFLQQPDAHVH